MSFEMLLQMLAYLEVSTVVFVALVFRVLHAAICL